MKLDSFVHTRFEPRYGTWTLSVEVSEELLLQAYEGLIEDFLVANLKTAIAEARRQSLAGNRLKC